MRFVSVEFSACLLGSPFGYSFDLSDADISQYQALSMPSPWQPV